MAEVEFVVSKALTGHMHYGSPIECFDNCGTCDGARCDHCKEKWWVEEVGDADILPGGLKVFNTKKEADDFVVSVLRKENNHG